MSDDQMTVLVKTKDGSFKKVPLSDLRKQKTRPQRPSVAMVGVAEDRRQRLDGRGQRADGNKDGVKKVLPSGSTSGSTSPEEKKQNRHDEVFYQKPSDVKKPPEKISPSTVLKKESNLEKPRTITESQIKNKKTAKTSLTAEDFKSPLEEKLDFVDKQVFASGPLLYRALTDEIVGKIPFQIDDNLKNRLRSAIELYLRDVRDLSQTENLLQRDKKEGGLGLNKEQTAVILKLLKQKHGKDLLLGQDEDEDDLPAILPPDELAVSTPFNAFEHEDFSVRKEEKNEFSRKKQDILKTKTSPVRKIPMSDMSSPNYTYGPVDDIKNFDLQDLRRLSSDYKESVARLKQKFLNLKEESILLFLQAVQAWHSSPLYLSYIGKIAESINQNRKLEMVLGGDGDSISLAEVMSLVKMEEELNL